MFSLLGEDLQMVCGFSCEDLISMFKELKGLGVVVKDLSNKLRQLVRREPNRLPECVFKMRVWSLGIAKHVQLQSNITY